MIAIIAPVSLFYNFILIKATLLLSTRNKAVIYLTHTMNVGHSPDDRSPQSVSTTLLVTLGIITANNQQSRRNFEEELHSVTLTAVTN